MAALDREAAEQFRASILAAATGQAYAITKAFDSKHFPMPVDTTDRDGRQCCDRCVDAYEEQADYPCAEMNLLASALLNHQFAAGGA